MKVSASQHRRINTSRQSRSCLYVAEAKPLGASHSESRQRISTKRYSSCQTLIIRATWAPWVPRKVLYRFLHYCTSILGSEKGGGDVSRQAACLLLFFFLGGHSCLNLAFDRVLETLNTQFSVITGSFCSIHISYRPLQ